MLEYCNLTDCGGGLVARFEVRLQVDLVRKNCLGTAIETIVVTGGTWPVLEGSSEAPGIVPDAFRGFVEKTKQAVSLDGA